MLLKLDLHVHTVYSDSRETIKETLNVAELKGLDGLAITATPKRGTESSR